MIKNKQKPEFEEKLQQGKDEETQPEPEKKGWFGRMRKKKRPRRSAEEIVQDRLAEAMAVDPKQVELLKPVLKMPFDIWADNVKVEELRLKGDEAESLAVPVAQLINYYLPRLSPIGYVWLSFGITTFGVMSIRIKLLAELRKQKKKPEEPPKEDNE